MKKYVFLFFLMFLFSLCFGCGSCTSDVPALQAPTVILTDDVATWTKIENAIEYEICINGNEPYLKVNVTEYKLNDGESLRVRAKGDDINYSTSEWSNEVKYIKESTTEEFVTIIWKNGDQIIDVNTEVKKGTVPVFEGNTPVKPSNGNISYEFTGWSPEVTNVYENTTYYALFKEVVNEETFVVMFYDGDKLIESQTVAKGNDANLPNMSDKNGLKFLGWDGNYKNIQQNENVYAIYNDSKNIFYLQKVENNTDGEFKLILKLDGTVKICGFDIIITYDNSIELLSYNDELDLSLIVNSNIENTLLMNFVSGNDLTTGKNIIELTFKCNDVELLNTIAIQVSNSAQINGLDYAEVEYKIINKILN